MKLGLRLGKKPARPGAMKFALSRYVDLSKLPPIPERFGHDGLIQDWGVLGNDRYGCCVWAGAAHETMMLAKAGGKRVAFSESNVLGDYAAVTGFNPSNLDTDQGTDMIEAASYRRKVGVLDHTGQRHKILAYLAIEPGNVEAVWAAAYLFGAVGIGVNFTGAAMQQFNGNQPWNFVKGAASDGGHYIPLVGKNGNELRFVSWGKVQPASVYWFERQCDEAVAYVSEESLVNNKSPEGFDVQSLLKDLAALAPG